MAVRAGRSRRVKRHPEYGPDVIFPGHPGTEWEYSVHDYYWKYSAYGRTHTEALDRLRRLQRGPYVTLIQDSYTWENLRRRAIGRVTESLRGICKYHTWGPDSEWYCTDCGKHAWRRAGRG